MGTFPKCGGDSTISLLREGYAFIPDRCRALGTDVFAARLMLSPVICAQGAEAAEVFYGRDAFTRRGAMPPTVLRLLQDKGSVQQLDGPAHRRRKAAFVGLLIAPAAVQGMRAAFREAWRAAVPEWRRRGGLVVFDEMPLVLTRAVRDWAGVPQDIGDDRAMAEELGAMVENAGRIAPGTLRALALRRRHERRIRRLVRDLREGRRSIPGDRPVAVIARHRDLGGEPISVESAAVETINILRPVVAIARYIGFATVALARHPEWRARFAAGDIADLEPFVEEVRRTAPFFPFVGGRVRRPFEWRGHAFAEGDWMLLDLYGTNHDPRLHPDPDAFRPGRGLDWRRGGFDFVPQGGGDAGESHRCPGEAITVAITAEAVRLLATEMRWRFPPQDLSVDLARIPARPASGVVLELPGGP